MLSFLGTKQQRLAWLWRIWVADGTIPGHFEDIHLAVVSELWGRSAGPARTGWSPEEQTSSQTQPPSPGTRRQVWLIPLHVNEFSILMLLRIQAPKLTSVSCSRCPIRDRDSPSSCRWAAASMGSTSGTRAGDRDMVPGARFGDTTPVEVPATLVTKRRVYTAAKVQQWEDKARCTQSLLYLCFCSHWRSCVWPWWLQLCFVCAANTEPSASRPAEKEDTCSTQYSGSAVLDYTAKI